MLVYDDPWYWIVNENVSDDKSKCIERAEQEKFEEQEKGTNDTLKEMMMMLDNLEKMCAENRKEIDILKEEKMGFEKKFERK